MRSRRWPWLLAAMVLLAAATATAWSTYLHWLPCRGALLSGSIIGGYRYEPHFSDACLRRMDSSPPFPYPTEPAQQAPWASELGVVAMVLASLAWLILLVGLRCRLRTTAVAALPALATLAVATQAAVALGDAGRSPADFLSLWFWLSIDAAAAVALVALWRWQPELRERFGRLLVVVWGATAFGFVQGASQYAFMILIFSDANWDVPPLTGYLTAATLAVSALLTVTITLRRPRTRLLEHSTAGPAEAPVSA